MAQEKIRVAGGRKPRKSKLTPEEKAEKKAAFKEHVENTIGVKSLEKEKKRAAAKAKLAEDIEKGIVVDPENESHSIGKLIEERAEKLARKIVDDKTAELRRRFKNAKAGRKPSGGREYEKFSCEQLINIFGGWFTLSYLFSIKNSDGTDTDFYVCSQDVSLMRANDRPKINKVIKERYGKTVYGFAIIAPSSAFE